MHMEKAMVCCCLVNRNRENETRVLTGFPQWQMELERNGKVKHELQVTNLNPRVTSSNLRVTSSNLRVRRLKARVA